MAGFVMGWGPCLTHSAPLLLPYIGATKGHWEDGLKIGLAFSGGRLLALGFLGGIATGSFSYINKFFPPHRLGWLYGIVALFMIAMGVLIVIRKGLRIQTGKSILNMDV
jgi:sulfite exporter TauE/SafE